MDEDEELMPDIGMLTTLWIADSLYGEKTQIAFIDGEDGIPALEEAPEQVSKKVLDLPYEISRPGTKSASQIEIPILYTMKQHKALKAKERKNLYFFEKYPENTADEAGKPLVKYFKGSFIIVDDDKSNDDYIKDKMTIYINSEVLESDGFPSQS